jgi:predicted nucleic acid-binding protein
MLYADTCYILALVLPADVFRANAERIRDQAQASSTTILCCETTFHELLMHIHNKGYDPLRYMRDALSLVEPDGVRAETLLKAAYYMDHVRLDPADALIAAHASDSGLGLVTSELAARDLLTRDCGLKIVNLRSPNVTI